MRTQWLVMAVSIGLVHSAHAEESWQGRWSVDLPFTKWMMPASASRTSDCIGRPVSPVCAAETWMACFSMRDPSLCERAGVKGVKFHPDWKSFAFFYEVISIKQVSPRNAAAIGSDSEWIRAGYAHVRVAGRACVVGQPCERTGLSVRDYFLRPAGNAWQLTGWHDDHGDAVCENYNPAMPYERECGINVPDDVFLKYLQNGR